MHWKAFVTSCLCFEAKDFVQQCEARVFQCVAIIWWRYGDVTMWQCTLYLQATNIQQINLTIALLKNHFSPGIVYQSLFLEKTRLDLRKRWRSGRGGGGGNQAYSFPASQKNRYPKDTCVRYLICIKGYEPMTVVWDTTGFPRKQKSNYAQNTNTTCLYCFVGRLCHQAKSCLTSTFYLRMCWARLDRLLLTLVSNCR